MLLETTWVLRYTYGLDRATIVTVLRKVLGLEGAVVEAHAEVLTAVTWYASGLDFADALHLASIRVLLQAQETGVYALNPRF